MVFSNFDIIFGGDNFFLTIVSGAHIKLLTMEPVNIIINKRWHLWNDQDGILGNNNEDLVLPAVELPNRCLR